MSYPYQSLIQYQAKAEPAPFYALPPPPPAPLGVGMEPFSNDHIYHMGVGCWLAEQIQYLMPFEVRGVPPPYDELITVDKWQAEWQFPVVYREIEYPTFDTNAAPPLPPSQDAVIVIEQWDKPFDQPLWAIEPATQTDNWVELFMGVYPEDPMSQERPWHTPFDDPVLPLEDTAALQEYAKLDLDNAQRAEFVEVEAYRQPWDLPAVYYDYLWPNQEAAAAVLSPFYLIAVEGFNVGEFPFFWPVPQDYEYPNQSGATEVEPVPLHLGRTIVLFVTPMLAGGFRDSRL